MYSRSLVASILGTGGVFVLASIVTVGTSVTEASALSLESAPMETFGPGDCAHHCRSCGTNKHDIVVHVSTNQHQSAHLENCNTGTCESHNCGSSALASRVQKLWNDAQAMEPEQLLAFLGANSDVAYYNAERHAVQFHCAEGKVVASLPIDSEAIPVLAGAGGQLPPGASNTAE